MIRNILRVYRAAFTGLPRDVWLLCVATLVNRAGSMVLPFFTLYLTQQRAMTPSEAGRMLGLYGIGSVIGAYAGGWLSDRVGSIRAQQISLLGSGVGFLALGVVESTASISAVVLLVSIVSEAFRPAVMTACAELAPEAVRARAFALLRLAVNLGLGVGPAIGGLLAVYDYRWLFVGDALTCWLAAGLLAVMLSAATAPRAQEPVETPEAARSPWSDGPFLGLLVLVLLLATAFFQVLSTLPLYLNQVGGFREDTIGLLLALNPLLIVVFEMVLIHWAERHDSLLLIGLGGFLVCAGFGLLPFGSSLGFIAFTIVIWTVGEMLALPLISTVVSRRGGPTRRGRYMGLFTMAFGSSFIFAPTAGTWVYETLGPAMLWYGVGLLGPVLFLGAVLLRGRWAA